MAEGTLFRLAGKALEELASLAKDELCMAWGFKGEIKKLSRTASYIQSGILDAEQQRNDNNQQLTLWLKELKDVLYDVEDLLDDVSTDALRRKIIAGDGKMKEVRMFFSKSNQLAYSLKMGHRVKPIRERLDAIDADRANFQLGDRPLEVPLVVRERDQTHSFVREQEIIGRDDDKNEIVQLLLQFKPEENVSIVPIVGIAGLGKTMLAKMVLNDEKLGDHFELRMWVCVLEKFELKVIVEKLIEAATERKPETGLQLETLQHHLRRNINGKRYLLVLDDVWNDDLEKWLSLKTLLLDGARGSWIVITTRSEVVARITGTVSSHVLQGLSSSDSWSLLKQMACKEERLESTGSRLEAIGMEIVDKCAGVPLALRAIGRVLYKRAEEEWIQVKNNVHIYIAQPEIGIMPILKLSYDHLPPHLKQCFAYCSLIGKDKMFSVPEMIRVWMALGFIQPLSGDEDLEDAAYEYFKELVWRSFLECRSMDYLRTSDSVFAMHDLMHDLACSVAGSEYCITNSKAENVNERARHVSFEAGLHFSWEIPNTLLKATKVRSFIPIGAGRLDASTLSVLMSNFKYLRMMDLSSRYTETIPDSIGKMKHLKALSLGGNLKTLPSSLSRLQNLKALDLRWCKNLESLPSKTSRLVSLVHLDIKGCDRLGYMPRGLGQLTCLQTLSKFVVGKRRKEVSDLKELTGLQRLEGKIEVSCLENAVIPEPGSAYLKEKLNLKSLKLSWSADGVIDFVKDEMVFESLLPHPNLEKLKVLGYPGRTISSWLSSITNLTRLCLQNCFGCKDWPPLHHLSSLKVLKLSGLVALENVLETEIQNQLLPAKSTTIFFPSLEGLFITHCPNLKGWRRPDDVGEASNAQLPCFPCLSYLYIEDCPNLISMPLFPTLRKLTLRRSSSKPLQGTMKMKRTTSELSPLSTSAFPCFSELETMKLEEIEDLHSIPSLYLLSSLKVLKLHGLEALENMFKIEIHKELQSADSTTTVLPSLEKLVIDNCPNLKG